MTARDREADLIGHVRTHETCTPECEDFRRLLGRVKLWRLTDEAAP